MRALIWTAICGGWLVGAADARPPDYTWEWYRAGETYLKYARPDARVSTKYFRKAAEMDNDAAQYKLGEHYEAGIGTAQSDAEAYRWYRRSADLGNKYAKVKVGEFLQKGRGVEQDRGAAARWYMAAAEQGNPWGHHMLGFMLADGDGIPKDEARARDCFEISVRETGDPWAKWRLATLIRSTDGERARRLLADAAAQGNPEAQRELALPR